MRSQEIARRYATALYQVAGEDGNVQDIQDELAQLSDAVAADDSTQRFLAHPLVPPESKSEFLSRAFPEVSERVQRLLHILVVNRRETYLDLIHEEYVRLRTEAEGRSRVSLLTAQPLSEQERERVLSQLEKTLNRPVLLDERTDPALIGGARIEWEGHVLDGSVRQRLAGLKKQLQE